MENEKINNLQKGDVIKGEILEIKGDLVLFKIMNHGVIEAKIDTHIPSLIGKPLNFVVNNIEDNLIELKAILTKNNDTPIFNKEVDSDTYSKILMKYELIDNDVSRKIIKNIYEFNLPITKRNIVKGLKAYNKFEQVFHKEESEKVIFLDDNTIEINNNEDLMVHENSNLNYKNVDISNFLVVKKNEYPSKNDLSSLFNNLFLKSKEREIDNQLLKIITYFIKKDVNITLNNIENFYEFIEDPDKFTEELMKVIKILNAENRLNFKRFKITFLENNMEDFKYYYKDLKNQLLKSQSIIRKNNFSSHKNTEYLEKVVRKLDFLNDMNRKLALSYIPIEINNENHTGFISILSRNRKRKNIYENPNIFIKLHMANLDEVKIYCEFNNRTIDIIFNIKEKEINRFRKKEVLLKELLKEKGFKVQNINYKIDEKLNILDTLIVNDRELYYLDVQV